MKKLLLVGLVFLGLVNLQAQNYYMAEPQGFAEGTTGGGTATPVTVSTYADLKTQLTSSGSKVILVSGTITFPADGQISAVITNKTLIGLPGAKLVNTTFTKSGAGIINLADGSNNVIIRNLIFEGPGAYDTDGRDNLTADGCTKLWVDHCEFQDGMDGNYDNKGNTDNVTISWCKFTYLKPAIPDGPGGTDDHRFTNLVGSSSTDAPTDKHFSITFQNCYWADGCKERMPRARNAELHILNCLYDTDVSSSTALGISGGDNNSTVYVEKCDFASVGKVYKDYSSSGDGGTVSITFDSCLNTTLDSSSATKPSYSYTSFPSDSVKIYVSNATCGAGATLQVSATGEISTLCDNTIYTLTTLTDGTGSGAIILEPDGGEYLLGTVIRIKAKADLNSTFDGWSGVITSTDRIVYWVVDGDATITATFTGDGTAIQNNTTNGISCYPTVVESSLFIDFSNEALGNTNITVYSANGQVVSTESRNILSSEKVELDFSTIPNGVYYCIIQNNQTAVSQKFVKQ